MPYQLDPGVLQSIRDLLLTRQHTIAVAESVTSGLLQVALSTRPDASQYYQGGITAFNIGQKARHLCVDPIHALSCNCVSEQVACQMAIQVCNFFNSTWGAAVTGYASPVPESDNQLFAFYAITFQDKVIDAGKIVPPADEPFNTQCWYANKVLICLNNSLTIR